MFKVNIICTCRPTGSLYKLYEGGRWSKFYCTSFVFVLLRSGEASNDEWACDSGLKKTGPLNPSLGLLSKSCRKLSRASTQRIDTRQRRMSSSSSLSFDQHSKLKENKKLTVWWIENQAEFEIGLMLFISMCNYRLFVIWKLHFWSQ